MVASSATTARASARSSSSVSTPSTSSGRRTARLSRPMRCSAHPAPRRLLPQLHQRRDPRRGQERDTVEIDDDVGPLGQVLAHPPVEAGRGQGVEVAPDLHDGERLRDVRGGDLQRGRLVALAEPRAGDDEAGLGHESGHPDVGGNGLPKGYGGSPSAGISPPVSFSSTRPLKPPADTLMK